MHASTEGVEVQAEAKSIRKVFQARKDDVDKIAQLAKDIVELQPKLEEVKESEVLRALVQTAQINVDRALQGLPAVDPRRLMADEITRSRLMSNSLLRLKQHEALQRRQEGGPRGRVYTIPPELLPA